MKRLGACFFPSLPSSALSSLSNSVDSTFIEFVEAAARVSQDVAEVCELVRGFFPEVEIEEKGLGERLARFKWELDGGEEEAVDVPVKRKVDLFEKKENAATSASTASTTCVGSSEEEEDVPEELDFLRGVCGLKDRSEDATLLFVLERLSIGKLEDAVRWVCDHDLRDAKAMLIKDEEMQKKREKVDREAERAARDRIVAKFDEGPELFVPDGKAKTSKVRISKKSSSYSVTAGGGGESNLRYLDGKVVGTKGQKFIEIQTKPDWDGGSKGVIKTKGKRGAGFIAG